MISFLHIAQNTPSEVFSQRFLDELRKIGTLTVVENGCELSDDEKIALLQKADVALTGWDSAPIPARIVDEPGALKYVCNVTGEMRAFVPPEIVISDILVSNWGDTPAISIAEGTVALLLSVLKDLHWQIMAIREDRWGLSSEESGGTLYKANVGVYGCGAIGRRFVSLIEPFGPHIVVYDPYCTELPSTCTRVFELRDLFEQSEIIIICAGLSDETRGSVTAEMLALLPRHGVVINTARGAIVDQDALFAELENGRLRAGLDVLEPDKLPQGHPARRWKNCIFTAHEIHRVWPTDGAPPTKLSAMHQVCIDNVRAFIEGRPIRFEMDIDRYNRSS